MRTETVDCTSKVVIRTMNDIPVMHERLEGLVDCCEGSVEYMVAEISKSFIVGILPGT